MPSDLDAALRLAQSETLIPMAGGTDLMVRFKSVTDMAAPPLFIGGLPELKGIARENGYLVIGGCETYADIIASPEVPSVFKQALSRIGSPAIRNQGTLGGNVCNASPAGDSLPLLYLYKAEVVLASARGERTLSIDDFITGPGRTARQEDELLVAVRIGDEYLSAPYTYVFEKMGNRKADAIAKASFAMRLALDGGVIQDMDAAFGAMGPRVTLLNDEIREMCLGRPFPLVDLDEPLLRRRLFSLLTPIDDQRSTAAYRKTVALNLLHHYLTTDSAQQA